MKNSYKNILIIFVMLLVCTLTLGYAAFGSEMSISNIVADVRINKDIRVTGVKFVSANNGSTSNLDYDYDSVVGNINLKSYTSTVTLEVSVTNFGNTEMGIYAINGLSDNLLKIVDNYEMGSKLCDSNGKCSLGSTTKFNITIGYDTYDAVTKDHELRLDFEFREMHTITYDGITNNNYPTSVIDGGNLNITFTSPVPPKVVPYTNGVKLDNYSYVNNTLNVDVVTGDIEVMYRSSTVMKSLYGEDTYYKEANYINKITSIEFVDYIDPKGVAAAQVSYDLSKDDDKSIMAWVDSNNKLWIGSEWLMKVTHLGMAFKGMSNVKSIVFDNIDTSPVYATFSMFEGCSSLTSLDLSMIKVNSVSNMFNMFNGCTNLSYINMSNWNTTNAMRMDSMFSGTAFTTLDLSFFDTSSVINMAGMFKDMSLLETLNISSFDTSSVKDFSSMFSGVSKLTTLNLGHFNTSSATNMLCMFYNMQSLNNLNISSFDTSKVTNMSNMFYNVKSLTSLDVTHFNTSLVTAMDYLFYGMEKLTSLDVSKFDTSSAKSMKHMFQNLYLITSLDLTNFNTSNVTEMHNMFDGCKSLQSLDLSKFDTTNVTRMDYMFRNASSLTSLDLTNFNTAKVTSMNYMFNATSSLTEILVSSSWVTSSTASNMFLNSGVSSLTVV